MRLVVYGPCFVQNYKQDYDFPIALISNEFIEDKMEISFKSGGIIVGQTRDSWR